MRGATYSTGVVAGTYIVSLGTGTGANAGGTYNVNISQTVTAQTITGTQYANGIQHGGNVSTDIKHLMNASAFSAAATTAPADPCHRLDPARPRASFQAGRSGQETDSGKPG